MIDKIKNNLLRMFNVIFIAVFGYLFIDAISRPSVLFTEMNPIILFVLFFTLLMLLYVGNKVLAKLSTHSLRILIGVSLLLFLSLQLFFFKYFKVIPSWDFGDVYHLSLNAVQQKFESFDPYLYWRYPNNIPYFLLMVTLMMSFSVMGIIEFLSPLIIFNLIIIFMSVIIMIVFIKRRLGIQRATLFMLFTLLVTPLYAYVPIVYTDTLVMIFPILGLFIYDLFYHSEHKYRYLWALLLGIVLVIGTLLKANVIILLVGIFIHYVMTEKSLKILGFIVVVSAMFLCGNLVYQKSIRPYVPIEKSEMGFPTTHWIMMGLKGVGGYDDEDVIFTEVLKNQGHPNEEISEEHLNVIESRLYEMGPLGLVKHLREKAAFTWNDGTYFAPEKLKRYPIEENTYQAYVFGEQNEVYVYLSQMAHLALLFFITLSGFKLFREGGFENVMAITLFGVVLFLLIWETRSRYLVLYLPFMIATASFGFEEFLRIIDVMKKRFQPRG